MEWSTGELREVLTERLRIAAGEPAQLERSTGGGEERRHRIEELKAADSSLNVKPSSMTLLEERAREPETDSSRHCSDTVARLRAERGTQTGALVVEVQGRLGERQVIFELWLA
jgi:hypothetical protein